MLVSVYLSEEVYNVLTMFGELGEVVNKIVDAGMSGKFDIMDKPNYGSRQGNNRFAINIKNEDYINLSRQFAVNSSRISLRRLLQWFVYDEIYNELGWEPIKVYSSKTKEKFNKCVLKIESDLIKLQRYSTNYQCNKIKEIIKLLKEV